MSWKILFILVSAFAYTRETYICYFDRVHLQWCTDITIRTLRLNLDDNVKIGMFPGFKEIASHDGKNTFASPGRDLVKTLLFYARRSLTWRKPYKKVLEFFYFVFLINLQILRTSSSFHQQFAKQTSSAAMTSDLFVVWYPALYGKCLLIPDSFSCNPGDTQNVHIRSKLTTILKKLSNLMILLSPKKIALSKIKE